MQERRGRLHSAQLGRPKNLAKGTSGRQFYWGLNSGGSSGLREVDGTPKTRDLRKERGDGGRKKREILNLHTPKGGNTEDGKLDLSGGSDGQRISVGLTSWGKCWGEGEKI